MSCSNKYERGSFENRSVYRTRAKALKAEVERANYGDPDEVQFEMCEFTDGRVAQRWRVGARSCVWWDSLQDLYNIHICGHPDYGTRVEWSDGYVEELWRSLLPRKIVADRKSCLFEVGRADSVAAGRLIGTVISYRPGQPIDAPDNCCR